jgi:hypothetical protein
VAHEYQWVDSGRRHAHQSDLRSGHKRWIALEGALRGLPAGSYGHWVEGNAGVGGRIGPVGVQLGYREMLVDFHQSGLDPNGINLRFSGPMASPIWSW